MVKDKKISERYKDYEDRALVNELLEYADACEEHCLFKYTDFLDPRQQRIAENVLSGQKGITYRFYGGMEKSERNICTIYSMDFEISEEDIPITILCITWSKSIRKLTHRDFLGSFMGCGIKREKIGDIILSEERAYAACMSDISRYLLYNLNKVGSTTVNVTETDRAPEKEENTRSVSTTVASLRLDSLLAAGYGISRTKAAEAIKAGKVKVNWEDTVNSAKDISRGDVVSLRGRGRIVLEEVFGTTKKDRKRIAIKKYL